MPAGTLQSIVTCSATGTVNSGICPVGQKLKLAQGYVLDTTSQTFFDTLFTSSGQLDLLIQGGFDSGAAELAVLGVMMMFATGLGVGVVANIIRKERI